MPLSARRKGRGPWSCRPGPEHPPTDSTSHHCCCYSAPAPGNLLSCNTVTLRHVTPTSTLEPASTTIQHIPTGEPCPSGETQGEVSHGGPGGRNLVLTASDSGPSVESRTAGEAAQGTVDAGSVCGAQRESTEHSSTRVTHLQTPPGRRKYRVGTQRPLGRQLPARSGGEGASGRRGGLMSGAPAPPTGREVCTPRRQPQSPACPPQAGKRLIQS